MFLLDVFGDPHFERTIRLPQPFLIYVMCGDPYRSMQSIQRSL